VSALFIAVIALALIFNYSIHSERKSRVLGESTTNLNPNYMTAIVIKDNENEWHGASASTEIQNIANDLKVTLYPEDLVSAFPDPKLKIGTTITINRAPIIYLHDGLNNIEMRSWSKTVSEFLKEKKIDLGPLDMLSPSLETKLNNKDTLTIIRIGERDESVEEVIAYQKIEKPTSDMYKGERKLQQKGSDGKRVKTFRLRYENNALVSKILINDEVIVQSQSQIVLVGTRPRITVRCCYNSWVEDASANYGADPNTLCNLAIKESTCHYDSVGYGPNGEVYYGLFQYEQSLWNRISPRAGFGGADIFDPRAQIYVTAWALTHGFKCSWPYTCR
jgi:hypothetical protein